MESALLRNLPDGFGRHRRLLRHTLWCETAQIDVLDDIVLEDAWSCNRHHAASVCCSLVGCCCGLFSMAITSAANSLALTRAAGTPPTTAVLRPDSPPPNEKMARNASRSFNAVPNNGIFCSSRSCSRLLSVLGRTTGFVWVISTAYGIG